MILSIEVGNDIKYRGWECLSIEDGNDKEDV